MNRTACLCHKSCWDAFRCFVVHISVVLFMGTLCGGMGLLPNQLRAAEETNRPNIVVMMVDDMGFSDLGCYGGEIQTPNLDRLAKNGIRLTQFYNCAKCETTRSTLMSGRYYPEVGNRKLAKCVTIAEAMKGGGYDTIMTGKWHLESDPVSRGFDRYFGHLSGATNFFTGDATFRLNQDKFTVPQQNFYTTDANVEYAIQFLEDRRPADNPFFLYVAFNAPHYPLQAPREEVEKYVGKYLGGWDRLRQKRFARQKEIGLFDDSVEPASRPTDVPAWNTLDDKQKETQDLVMATYAAMIDRVDQNVGLLVEYLKRRGELDNTLILFLSDNGACPFQRTKKKTLEQNLKPWDPQSYWTYDKRWAHACNTPFREYKQNQHEGGISTAFIAHWPQGIAEQLRGSWNRDSAHLVDIMATCLDLGEVKVAEGSLLSKVRGISLGPIFEGKKLERKNPLFFSFYGKNNALRQGDWKLVNIDYGPWELYNLATDRTELTDLAEVETERFEEMKNSALNWFREVGETVRPKPKPRRRGKGRGKERAKRAK